MFLCSFFNQEKSPVNPLWARYGLVKGMVKYIKMILLIPKGKSIKLVNHI